MKTLFVSNDPSLFTPSSASRARMRAYAEAVGGELHVLSANVTAVEEVDGKLHLHGVRTMRLARPLTLAKRAHELILAHGIDVVSAQDPFEQGWAAARAIRGTKAKLHLQVHTDFLSPWFVRTGNMRSPRVPMPVLLNRVRRLLADYTLPKAAGIRVVSKRVKDSLTKRYGTRIVEPSVIPIAVSTDVPAAVPLPPHNFKFVFMSIGRLEPEKRIEDLLNALVRVHLRYPAAGLMIANEGRERARLEWYVKKFALEKNVMFIGARSDIRGLLKSAHAFVQSSAYEGYGLALVEAALAHVPIITTDVGIVGEVFKGYTDVLAVPVADPAALAVAMVGMMEDVQARELMVRSAEGTVHAHLASYPNQPALVAADLAKLAAT
jgi:glycosyltransferase involved in cell wall biosynthesis